MSSLLLPPRILRQQRLEREKRILRCTTVDDPRCQHYTSLLKLRTQDAWMVRAHNTVDSDLPLRPGYYHILILNGDEPMTVIPITNNGKYVEPGDWIFEQLNRMDLREKRVMNRLIEREREEYEAGERELQQANENRRERLAEIVTANTRVQVSMNRDTPWSQNVSGRRR